MGGKFGHKNNIISDISSFNKLKIKGNLIHDFNFYEIHNFR